MALLNHRAKNKEKENNNGKALDVVRRIWGAICSPLITHVLGQHL